MKLTIHWKKLLSILSALSVTLLSGCGGVEVKDTVIWSYVGDVNGVAAIGSHTIFDGRLRKNVDQWIDFLAATAEHGPAICMSSADYTKQKTALEQACAKINCSYEQQKEIHEITNRVDKHIAKVKSLSRSVELQSANLEPDLTPYLD